MKYKCDYCGYIYDEELGYDEQAILPGTKFKDLIDFDCPLCERAKDSFMIFNDEFDENMMNDVMKLKRDLDNKE